MREREGERGKKMKGVVSASEKARGAGVRREGEGEGEKD